MYLVIPTFYVDCIDENEQVQNHANVAVCSLAMGPDQITLWTTDDTVKKSTAYNTESLVCCSGGNNLLSVHSTRLDNVIHCQGCASNTTNTDMHTSTYVVQKKRESEKKKNWRYKMPPCFSFRVQRPLLSLSFDKKDNCSETDVSRTGRRSAKAQTCN